MKNPIREKLDRGGLLLCMMLRQSDMAAAEIAAQYGIDMLCIDNEHYPFNPQRVEALARAAQIYGSGVVIRVPNEEAARVAQMMDCQLQGIKIPHVETKEQALAIVNAVKYAPVGTRGFCPITRAAEYGFGKSAQEYAEFANEHSIVMVQIETKEGVADLDRILSIPEIDCIDYGPSDLAASYGKPGHNDDPEVQRVVRDIIDRARAAGKNVGEMAYTPEAVRALLERGVRHVSIGSDQQIIAAGCKALLEAAYH